MTQAWEKTRDEYIAEFVANTPRQQRITELRAKIAAAQQVVDAGPQTERATGPKSGIKNKARAMASDGIFNRYSEANKQLAYLKRELSDLLYPLRKPKYNPAEDPAVREHCARGMHEDSVRLAFAAGKPVPAHVLADYPDLCTNASP